MKTLTEKQALTHGYYLTRGSYSGTVDNHIDRWYWQRTNTDYLDFRGEGHSSKRTALEALSHHVLLDDYYLSLYSAHYQPEG